MHDRGDETILTANLIDDPTGAHEDLADRILPELRDDRTTPRECGESSRRFDQFRRQPFGISGRVLRQEFRDIPQVVEGRFRPVNLPDPATLRSASS